MVNDLFAKTKNEFLPRTGLLSRYERLDEFIHPFLGFVAAGFWAERTRKGKILFK